MGSHTRTFAREDGKEGVAFVGSVLVRSQRGPAIVEVSAFGDSVPAAQKVCVEFKERAQVQFPVTVAKSGRLMFDVA